MRAFLNRVWGSRLLVPACLVYTSVVLTVTHPGWWSGFMCGLTVALLLRMLLDEAERRLMGRD